MNETIANPASERAVIAGVFNHGSDAFIDVDDIIDVKSFTLEENQIIYSCLKKVFETSNVVDLPSLLSAAESLGLESSFDNKIPSDHIRAMSNMDIAL